MRYMSRSASDFIDIDATSPVSDNEVNSRSCKFTTDSILAAKSPNRPLTFSGEIASYRNQLDRQEQQTLRNRRKMRERDTERGGKLLESKMKWWKVLRESSNLSLQLLGVTVFRKVRVQSGQFLVRGRGSTLTRMKTRTEKLDWGYTNTLLPHTHTCKSCP